MKGLLSKKKTLKGDETVVLTKECSAIIQSKLPRKMPDPRSFQISYTIGSIIFNKVLCDLGASINLMLLWILMEVELVMEAPFEGVGGTRISRSVEINFKGGDPALRSGFARLELGRRWRLGWAWPRNAKECFESWMEVRIRKDGEAWMTAVFAMICFVFEYFSLSHLTSLLREASWVSIIEKDRFDQGFQASSSSNSNSSTASAALPSSNFHNPRTYFTLPATPSENSRFSDIGASHRITKD
ncbi:Retrotransposon gag protein [Arachis hypogaea]|nr:Retrotransposon gag protein [Arachis hypogaea]